MYTIYEQFEHYYNLLEMRFTKYKLSPQKFFHCAKKLDEWHRIEIRRRKANENS